MKNNVPAVHRSRPKSVITMLNGEMPLEDPPETGCATSGPVLATPCGLVPGSPWHPPPAHPPPAVPCRSLVSPPAAFHYLLPPPGTWRSWPHPGHSLVVSGALRLLPAFPGTSTRTLLPLLLLGTSTRP